MESLSGSPLTKGNESGMALSMLISIARDGQEIGEWTDDQVRALSQDGQLLGTDYYWHEGMPAWLPLRSLLKPAPPAEGAGGVSEPTVPPVQVAPVVVGPVAQPPPLPVPVAVKKPGRNWSAESFGCLRFFLSALAYILAAGVTRTYLLSDPELVSEVFYGAVAGFVAGLIPLVIAKRKGMPCQRYFLICGGAGAVGGLLLAGPLCVGLAIYLYLKHPKGLS